MLHIDWAEWFVCVRAFVHVFLRVRSLCRCRCTVSVICSVGLQRFHSRWRFNVSIWFQHRRLNCTFTQANSTSARILRTLLCAHIYICKLSFPLTLLFPSLFHRRLKVISPGKHTGNLQEDIVCSQGNSVPLPCAIMERLKHKAKLSRCSSGQSRHQISWIKWDCEICFSSLVLQLWNLPATCVPRELHSTCSNSDVWCWTHCPEYVIPRPFLVA